MTRPVVRVERDHDDFKCAVSGGWREWVLSRHDPIEYHFLGNENLGVKAPWLVAICNNPDCWGKALVWEGSLEQMITVAIEGEQEPSCDCEPIHPDEHQPDCATREEST